MRGVSRRFGATVALAGVDLDVAPGEVHALIGENGAGKSTLMKILAGALRPDAGHMELDGRSFAPHSPLAARRAGVAMIYQELSLAPHLTVEQNITLGVEHHRFGVLRPRALRDRAAEILARLGRPDLPLHARVLRLPAAERQIVEIARALLLRARVLVMDEPTSSLGPADVDPLFERIGRLSAEGVSIIYISHFLDEVRRIADRCTVLRDGRGVASGRLADVTPDELVEKMIGRRIEEMFPRVDRALGPPVLSVHSLSGRRTPTDISLTLHRGEIVGLAGLIGAGRTELLRCVYGLDPVRRGEVRVASLATRTAASPSRRLAQGVGLLSEDRKTEGLALSRSLADNLLLSRLSPFASLGVWLDTRAMHAAAADWMQRLGIRARGPAQPVSALSGGNQQKVALARLLHHDVDVLLLDEPTRGIDVGSKTQIYALIGRLAAQGKAILFASSVSAELLGVCDRIAVLHRGRLAAVRPVQEWTEHTLARTAATGRSDADAR